MQTISKWNSLSNEEFINQLSDRIEASPVIAELARRLEYRDVPSFANALDKVVCPICEAEDLQVTYNEGNNLFTLGER